MQNPTTNCPSTPENEKVKLEATVDSPPDFVITKVCWSGDDVKPGYGDLGLSTYPYEYEAAPATHGEKTVVCTIAFTDTKTGLNGTYTKTEKFKLYFKGVGEEDPGLAPGGEFPA